MKKPSGPPLPPVVRWQPWAMGVCCGACLLLASTSGWAQAQRRAPARVDGTDSKQTAPTRESKSAPLSAKQLEEALQLLINADSLKSRTPKALGPESAGLVIDQTISKIGHDFYDVFYSTFEAPPGVVEFSVVITERPSRGNNALVAISVNNTDLFEMPLQARIELIESAAADAVASVYGYLEETRNVSQQLERGELRGTEQY